MWNFERKVIKPVFEHTSYFEEKKHHSCYFSPKPYNFLSLVVVVHCISQSSPHWQAKPVGTISRDVFSRNFVWPRKMNETHDPNRVNFCVQCYKSPKSALGKLSFRWQSVKVAHHFGVSCHSGSKTTGLGVVLSYSLLDQTYSPWSW